MPASFNFPHTGKLLSLSFILFAGWFADAAVPSTHYPQLALTGLVTFFGSLNAAVPFLLDLFRIPADTFQLFLATGVINSRFGTLVAAVHTLTVALLGTCAVTGVGAAPRADRCSAIRPSPPLLTLAVIGGTRVVFAQLLPTQYTKDQVLAACTCCTTRSPAVVQRPPPGPERCDEPAAARGAFARAASCASATCPTHCRSRSSTRRGDLVGLRRRARAPPGRGAGRRARVPSGRPRTLAEQLADGYCDLVMSGVAVTTLRAATMLVLDVVPGRDARVRRSRTMPANTFASWDDIRALRRR